MGKMGVKGGKLTNMTFRHEGVLKIKCPRNLEEKKWNFDFLIFFLIFDFEIFSKISRFFRFSDFEIFFNIFEISRFSVFFQIFQDFSDCQNSRFSTKKRDFQISDLFVISRPPPQFRDFLIFRNFVFFSQINLKMEELCKKQGDSFAHTYNIIWLIFKKIWVFKDDEDITVELF